MLSQTQIKTLSQLGLPNWQLRGKNTTDSHNFYRLHQLMFCCDKAIDVNKPVWAQDLMRATDSSFVAMSTSAAAHWPEHLRIDLDSAACAHNGVLTAAQKREIWQALEKTSNHDG